MRAIISLKENNAAMLRGRPRHRRPQKPKTCTARPHSLQGFAGASSLGAGVQLGAQASRQVHQAMRGKQLEHSNRPDAKPVEYLGRVLDEGHPTEQEMVDALFPAEDTLTDEQLSQAHETIKTLANPRPLPWSRMRRKKRLPARPMRPPAKSMRDGWLRPLKV